MFSEKVEYNLEVKLPDPYLSTYLVNYIQEGDKFHIIITGEWKRKLKNCSFAYVHGDTYSASEESVDSLLDSFRRKYGSSHLEQHGLYSGTGFLLEKTDIPIRNRYEILGNEFDDVSKNYESSVKGNPVEVYMRGRTSMLLSHFARDGMNILEIGCGTLIEASAIRSKVSLTCAELSDEMISRAKENSKSLSEIGVEMLKVSSGFIRTGKKYDIIFTTFGYLDLEKIETVEATLRENLKDGGIFIGAYWNRLGFLDLLISMLLGRSEYLKQKNKGNVLPDFSRFTTATRPKNPYVFSKIRGFTVIKRIGVCTLIPPYNFNRVAKRLSNKKVFFALDLLVSSIPIIKNFADYIIVVLRRENES